ncbi:plasmid maintenance system antidote protein [Blastococcus sp. TF02-8]|uniref:ImmA/IrrE family metallo-endopeptidase n=1 Tax=Blastococcus sp. TF02-8 TaxID=2250574 RepID=UPI000DEB2C6E|nr:ImmA/IrrE family metallo-endopeptidase [Blastococcus sp. TF02-8]RBY97112.1 plasmid maintenance system antidote protein [Blastococcus sp. TF02-8]
MTSTVTQLTPRWASPPGRTIQAILSQIGRTPDDLSELLDVDSRTAAALLNEDFALSPELAGKLSKTLGSSPQFWMTRYEQYREDLLRVQADRWARSAPADLSRFGWVQKSDSWLSRISDLFDFFDVPDLPTWRARYAPALVSAHYRKSETFEADELAVAAWLRRAQLESRSLRLGAWDPARFETSVAEARRLTWRKDPNDFLPTLVAACAAAGVALVVVRAPKGCPASGATYTTEEGAPLIVLSGRYLSDDHLWFTFFHEAAHVLLHHGVTFVDELDPAQADETEDDREREANEWAASMVLSPQLLQECRSVRLTHKAVLRIAYASGVAPGLVVGQLQHAGLVSPSQLNKLKRRYNWNGPSLETA